MRTVTDYPKHIIPRYVDIPCPSGKHPQSWVTFHNHTVAAMFCIPCEHAWTESTTNPELRHLSLATHRLSDLAFPPST